MFKRLATVAPRSFGSVVTPRITPVLSGVQQQTQSALRTSPAPQRRGYHEKDMFPSVLCFRPPSLVHPQNFPGKKFSEARNADLSALLDHYNNPRNVGALKKGDEDVGTGLVGAPACGDVMKLQIKVDPDSNKINDVKFKTFGCGSAIASSSYLTELVRGMTLDEAGRIRNTEIAKELCLPPVKLHCSMLAEDAIKSAISDYYTKNPATVKTDLGGTGASIPDVKVEIEKDAPAATV